MAFNELQRKNVYFAKSGPLTKDQHEHIISFLTSEHPQRKRSGLFYLVYDDFKVIVAWNQSVHAWQFKNQVWVTIAETEAYRRNPNEILSVMANVRDAIDAKRFNRTRFCSLMSMQANVKEEISKKQNTYWQDCVDIMKFFAFTLFLLQTVDVLANVTEKIALSVSYFLKK
jgi:hypothetical protein